MPAVRPISEAGEERALRSDERAQRHLGLQCAVTKVLSEAQDVATACREALELICKTLRWPWGAFWSRKGDELRLIAFWRSPQLKGHDFGKISRACHFVIGEGVPGKTWATGEPFWVVDFANDLCMPRRAAAAEAGFHSGVGIPVGRGELLGVLEAFTCERLDRDPELLEMLMAVAEQVAQFLERRRTQEALAQAERLFHGVFEGAQDAILLVNDQGRFIDANPAAARLLGLSKEEIQSKNFWDLIPVGQQWSAREGWVELLDSPVGDKEFVFVRKDGTPIDLELRATPQVVPGVHLTILRDVTTRRRRERNARLLAAAGAILGEGLDLQATIDRISRIAVPEFADWCVLDMLESDGAIRRVAMAHEDPNIEERVRALSRAVPIDPARKFGAPNVIRTGSAELLEITDDLLRATTPDQKQFELAQNLKLGGSIVAPLQVKDRVFGALSFWRTRMRPRFSHADIEFAEEVARRTAWALENARLFESAQEELRRRELAEAQLKELNAELERRVVERTAELKESHSQLEAFCYSVSHDLRAPLRSMQGFSHALIDDHLSNLNEEGQDFARRILAGAEHMDGLLADVLAYSRLSRQEFKREAVYIREVAEDVRVQLQSQIAEKRAELRVEGCDHKVIANRSVLELMLVNLIENALKFVPAEKRAEVSLTCERRGELTRICVRDNGIGIAPEHHQQIFRIFERLHGIETYPGTGIGLALVHKAAERLDGSVGVVSSVGQGSSFWIQLPTANSSLQ